MDATNRLYSRKLEIYYQKTIKMQLIIHDHHLIKGSRVITLDKLTSTEIYSILILKVQNKTFSNIYFEKTCSMTLILTGQQFICYHA